MRKQVLKSTPVILLALASFVLVLVVAAQEEIKVSSEVVEVGDTQRYTSQVVQLMADAIHDTRGFVIVPRREARYVVKGTLVAASEVVVDNIPTAEVGFVLRVYEINPETTEPFWISLVNSNVQKQLVGVLLGKAIEDTVKATTANGLEMLRYRINPFPARKSP